MKTPNVPPSRDAILDALRQAMTKDRRTGEDDGVSVRELMKATGRNQDVVRDWLRERIAAGTVEVVRAKKLALDGRLSTVSAYRLRNGKPA